MSVTNNQITAAIPFHEVNSMLRRAIKSVLNDLETGDELLLVDDRPVDDAISIEDLDSIADGFLGTIRVVKTASRGIVGARNLAISEAKHELVSFLDSDDEWIASRRDRHIKLLSKNTLAPGVSGQVIFQCIHEHSVGRSRASIILPQSELGRFFPRVRTSGATIRRSAAIAAGGFIGSEADCEDYGAWLRLQVQYGRFLNDRRPVAKYTIHDNQVSKIIGRAASLTSARLTRTALGSATEGSGVKSLEVVKASMDRRGLISFLLTGSRPATIDAFRDLNWRLCSLAVELFVSGRIWQKSICQECRGS